VSKTGTSAPPAVNAGALLTQQGMANNSAAELQAGLNNTGVSGPLGNTFYTPTSIDPGTGMNATWEQSQQLAPGPQNAFNNQATLAGNLPAYAGQAAGGAAAASVGGRNLLNQGLSAYQPQLPGATANYGGLPALPTSTTDFSNEVNQAQNAAYNTQEAYLAPQQAEQQSAETQQLADQGLSPGSAAFNQAEGDLSRSQTFANQQAQNAAVAAGNQEQSTLFGENLQARQQGVNEANTLWSQPFQALQNTAGLGANLTAQGASELPGLGSLGNFTWAGGIPGQGGSNTTVTPPNYGTLQSAANQGNQNAFAAGNTLNNQLFSQLGSLANGVGGSNLLFGSGGLSGALGLSPSTGLLGSLGGLFGGGGVANDAGLAASLLAAPFTGV
jgi:hypothetical protein